jgi:hypothetical protein
MNDFIDRVHTTATGKPMRDSSMTELKVGRAPLTYFVAADAAAAFFAAALAAIRCSATSSVRNRVMVSGSVKMDWVLFWQVARLIAPKNHHEP